jgi:hypothetical protein
MNRIQSSARIFFPEKGDAPSARGRFSRFQAMGANKTTCNGLLRMRYWAVSLGRWFIEKLSQGVKKKSFLFCKGISDMIDVKSGFLIYRHGDHAPRQ